MASIIHPETTRQAGALQASKEDTLMQDYTAANKSNAALSKAGVTLALLAGLWLAAAPVIGHMGRPWPCFVLGLAVLASLAMAWKLPRQRRGWSILVIVFSACAFLLGTSGIVPGLLGVAGGVFLIEWSLKGESLSQTP